MTRVLIQISRFSASRFWFSSDTPRSHDPKHSSIELLASPMAFQSIFLQLRHFDLFKPLIAIHLSVAETAIMISNFSISEFFLRLDFATLD